MRFGYKGAALAGLAEILSAILTGMPYCSQLPGMAGPDFSTPRHLGHFFLVIDPKRFVSKEIYDLAIREYLADLRGQPARSDNRVMAPGDREWAVEVERCEQGIPVAASLQANFAELAGRLHIPPPQYK